MVDERSGLSADELFVKGEGITYSDFTILDTRLTEIARDKISLETDLGKGVVLKTPIIASPMDTVTNDRVCIALALQGGIGVIHYNHRDLSGNKSIDAQIAEIKSVKRFQNGFIEDPVTVAPNMTIANAMEIGETRKTADSAITTFPVTKNGLSSGLLVGLLRKQDYIGGMHAQEKVGDKMLGLDALVTMRCDDGSPPDLDAARDRLIDKHISFLPVVNGEGELRYLVTSTDIRRRVNFPLSTTDGHDRLQVLFAVDTWPESHERLERGFAAGADGVVIDTSQGYSVYEREMIEHIRQRFGDKLLIGGNISTLEGARFLAENEVDAYRCGQGPGSICTTGGAIGISRAGATGVYECAHELHRNDGVMTIADGGLRETGDILKALAIGADCVMLGNLLAGVEEGPGDVITDRETGVPVKVYRGMGSAEAVSGGSSLRDYTNLPEGVVGRVEFRGSIHDWIPRIRDGLVHALEVVNLRNLTEIHKALYDGSLRFERKSYGAIKEGGTHSLK